MSGVFLVVHDPTGILEWGTDHPPILNAVFPTQFGRVSSDGFAKVAAYCLATIRPHEYDIVFDDVFVIPSNLEKEDSKYKVALSASIGDTIWNPDTDSLFHRICRHASRTWEIDLEDVATGADAFVAEYTMEEEAEQRVAHLETLLPITMRIIGVTIDEIKDAQK